MLPTISNDVSNFFYISNISTYSMIKTKFILKGAKKVNK